MTDGEIEKAIIGVSVQGDEGLGFLRKIVEKLSSNLEILKASSVYRLKGDAPDPRHVHDLRSNLFFESLNFSLLVQSRSQGPEAILAKLRATESALNEQSARRSVRLYLFFYGQRQVMTPELTLPYTDFHLHGYFIALAAELSPDQIHPIFKRTLRQLAKERANLSAGEFFCQGKSLLDF